jgi:hypothetical protein
MGDRSEMKQGNHDYQKPGIHAAQYYTEFVYCKTKLVGEIKIFPIFSTA